MKSLLFYESSVVSIVSRTSSASRVLFARVGREGNGVKRAIAFPSDALPSDRPRRLRSAAFTTLYSTSSMVKRDCDSARMLSDTLSLRCSRSARSGQTARTSGAARRNGEARISPADARIRPIRACAHRRARPPCRIKHRRARAVFRSSITRLRPLSCSSKCLLSVTGIRFWHGRPDGPMRRMSSLTPARS